MWLESAEDPLSRLDEEAKVAAVETGVSDRYSWSRMALVRGYISQWARLLYVLKIYKIIM